MSDLKYRGQDNTGHAEGRKDDPNAVRHYRGSAYKDPQIHGAKDAKETEERDLVYRGEHYKH